MIKPFFKESFGYSPTHARFSPGRVNLIGEHTDYNGGYVLPTALPLGLRIAAAHREDERIRISSKNYNGIAEGSTADKATDHWSDYAKGCVILANETGLLKGGMDIAVDSNLPHGAGLSSSAAICVGVLKLVRDISGSPLDDTEIAKIARTVENDYIGMPCGIMDQMAVAISEPGQAMKLDTKDLSYELIEIPNHMHMAVIHSGQYRRLSEGRYKERKEECDVVKQHLGRTDICLMSDAEFASLCDLPNHIIARARHCLSDHRRTDRAATALANDNMIEFGRLMIESHISMRDDFEITLPQIDALVDDAVSLGALGARMTGGGFGGCIVACIERTQLESWKADLLEKHPDAFYVC